MPQCLKTITEKESQEVFRQGRERSDLYFWKLIPVLAQCRDSGTQNQLGNLSFNDLVCPIITNVNFEHLIKVVSARFLHCGYCLSFVINKYLVVKYYVNIMFLNKLVIASTDSLTPSFHLYLIVDILLKEELSLFPISYLFHYRCIKFYFIQQVKIHAEIIPDMVSESPCKLTFSHFNTSPIL